MVQWTEGRELEKRWQIRKFQDPEEAERADREYWLSLTPEERIEAVELCRLDYWRMRGEKPQGLRRVLRVLERG